MRAIGKIAAVQYEGSTVKVSQKTGESYISNRYTIFFESGDDTHMITIFVNVFPGQDADEILRKRNYFVGARGEMTIKYGFRDWNGKKFIDTDIMNWECDNKQTTAAPAHAQEVAHESISAAPAEVVAEFAADVDKPAF